MTSEETFNKLKEPAPVTNEYGTRCWYNAEGNIHRDNDLPAVIFGDGEQWWCINGLRYRENGPALIRPDGTEEFWFKNGTQIR